ncbi:MAG: hypothetical protein AAGB01_12445, partial [Cyanobacteria bacterium P01_F01_bin.42]
RAYVPHGDRKSGTKSSRPIFPANPGFELSPDSRPVDGLRAVDCSAVADDMAFGNPLQRLSLSIKALSFLQAPDRRALYMLLSGNATS